MIPASMARSLPLGILIGFIVGSIITGGIFTMLNVTAESRRRDADAAREAQAQTQQAIEQGLDARKAELDARSANLDARAAAVAFDESVREYIADESASGVNPDGTPKTVRYLTLPNPKRFSPWEPHQDDSATESALDLKWGVDTEEFDKWKMRRDIEIYPKQINPNGRARLDIDKAAGVFSAVAKLSQSDLHLMSVGSGTEILKQYPRFDAATIWCLGVDTPVSDAVFMVDGARVELHRSRQKPWIFMLTAKQMDIIASGRNVALRWDGHEMQLKKEDKQAFEDVRSIYSNGSN
jgi:multidrug efflux pump subunit AcrA (membrane-fusion protein)